MNYKTAKDYCQLLNFQKKRKLYCYENFHSAMEQLFNNLLPRHFYTVAGRPGMGKTSILLSMAEIAAASGKKVLFIFNDDVCPSLPLNGVHQNYDFLYEKSISLSEINHVLRKKQYDVLLIDSFQEISGENRSKVAERLYKHALYSQSLLVIVGSSLSRRPAHRPNHRPRAFDMTRKMCGTLWKYSDSVFFLYRDDYYNLNLSSKMMEIQAIKNFPAPRYFKFPFQSFHETSRSNRNQQT